MKRMVILSGVIFLIFSSLQAQNFNEYFVNKTLRINYHHIGNKNSEKFEIKTFHAGGTWNGTRSQLVENKRYGDVLFELFDSVSNKLIYTRSYSCLFNEYRATERAETETGTFEECIIMPLPKNSVKYAFTTYDRKNNASKMVEGYYNPKETKTEPFKKEYKTMNLHIAGSPEKCLDILFIPDGYAKSDAKKLEADMKRFSNYIMNCSPYKENSKLVNIRAIKGFSEESGINDPASNTVKKTLLNSTFNVIDVDRYLMCLNVWRMNEIADDAPYDAIVIIANTSKYGGGGIYNFYATVTNDSPRADYVIVHELGHSVGGLADEYYTSEVSVQDYYPTDIEPVEPNLTTMVNFDSKWKKDIRQGTPVPTPATKEYQGVLGAFEGGGYVAHGVFRPWLDCTMKEAKYDNFCPVCKKVLIETFEYYSK